MVSITVENKTPQSAFYCAKLLERDRDRCSNMGYVIDGVNGPILELIRGESYEFHIDSPGHPFYFTSDPVGGMGPADSLSLISQNLVTDKGSWSITIDDTFPYNFYYQCQAHPRMGGPVKIIDQ